MILKVSAGVGCWCCRCPCTQTHRYFLFEARDVWCTVTAGSCGVTAVTVGHRWPLDAHCRPEESGGPSQVKRRPVDTKLMRSELSATSQRVQTCSGKKDKQQNATHSDDCARRPKSRAMCPEASKAWTTGVKDHPSLKKQSNHPKRQTGDGLKIEIKACFKIIQIVLQFILFSPDIVI